MVRNCRLSFGNTSNDEEDDKDDEISESFSLLDVIPEDEDEEGSRLASHRSVSEG
jgi:hypothetical protein